jgi:hypothetical protein
MEMHLSENAKPRKRLGSFGQIVLLVMSQEKGGVLLSFVASSTHGKQLEEDINQNTQTYCPSCGATILETFTHYLELG